MYDVICGGGGRVPVYYVICGGEGRGGFLCMMSSVEEGEGSCV